MNEGAKKESEEVKDTISRDASGHQVCSRAVVVERDYDLDYKSRVKLDRSRYVILIEEYSTSSIEVLRAKLTRVKLF